MLPDHVGRHQSDRGGNMDACPKCTHPHVVKAGKARGKQRWLCRGCGYQFTCTTPRGRPPWQKSLAVFLYCHGVSMNALGKMFGVWASTILTWIRRYAADHSEKPAPSGKAIVLELDEMWHFLKKNGANSGSGRLLIVIQAASLTGSVGVVMRQP
jgi:transposase